MTDEQDTNPSPGGPQRGGPHPNGPQPNERQPSAPQPGSEAVDAAARARAEAEVDRRLLESSLVRLRATGHPLLRSMADDLLAGRVSMRELARNPGIAAPIQAAAQRYLRWRNSRTPAELQAISDDMAARVQWMRDQVAMGWKKRNGDSGDRGNSGTDYEKGKDYQKDEDYQNGKNTQKGEDDERGSQPQR